MADEKLNAFFINEEPLISYLKVHPARPENKNYEILVAIWLCRIISAAKKTVHCIGFELVDELKRISPDFDFRNPEHIKTVLEKYRKDSGYDAFIPEGTAAEHKPEGLAFQFKQLPTENVSASDFTNAAAEFTEKFKRRYGKMEAVLVIIPKPKNGNIAIPKEEQERLSQAIKEKIGDDFPFSAIWYLGLTPKDEVMVVQHWPDFRLIGKL